METNQGDARLIEKLHEKLARSLSPGEFTFSLRPDPDVGGSDGCIAFYDFDGVTFGSNAREQEIINAWLTVFFSNHIGYPIEIMRESDGNGHCVWWFRRRLEKPKLDLENRRIVMPGDGKGRHLVTPKKRPARRRG